MLLRRLRKHAEAGCRRQTLEGSFESDFARKYSFDLQQCFKIYNICTLLGCFQAFSPFWIPTSAPHQTRKFSQACGRSGGGRVREGLPGVEHRRPLVARIADGQDVAPAVLQPGVGRLRWLPTANFRGLLLGGGGGGGRPDYLQKLKVPEGYEKMIDYSNI